MKSLHLEELKKHEAVPDSYEISVAYRGRKVDVILDNYEYSLQQLLDAANDLLVHLPMLDCKARKFLAHEDIDRFNECNKENKRPEASEEYLERIMILSAIQFFDESIDFFYKVSCYKNYELIVEVNVAKGYDHPEFQQWFVGYTLKNKFLDKVTSFFKKMF